MGVTVLIFAVKLQKVRTKRIFSNFWEDWKKGMWSNIIKMKLTEEKRYWNFCLWLFLAEVRLNVLGMCIT